MKRGRMSPGFTIVEVLIVLGVSSAILISGLLLINGQQERTQFTQSSNNALSQVNQVINTVSTGYYSKSANFKCSASIGPTPKPSLDFGSTSEQGGNRDCIFVGKVMQFGVDPDSSGYDVFTLIGLRLVNGTGDDVASLADAHPVALFDGANPVGTIEKNTLSYGLRVKGMKYTINAADVVPNTATATVGFITDFAGGSLASGSRHGELYTVQNTNLGDGDSTTATNIDTPGRIIPVAKVSICFEGGTKNLAILSIGGNGRELSTTLDIIAEGSGGLEAVCS